MTKLYALRVAETGIGVFEIRPGIIRTDMTAVVKHRYDKQIGEGISPTGVGASHTTSLASRCGLPVEIFISVRGTPSTSTAAFISIGNREGPACFTFDGGTLVEYPAIAGFFYDTAGRYGHESAGWAAVPGSGC